MKAFWIAGFTCTLLCSSALAQNLPAGWTEVEDHALLHEPSKLLFANELGSFKRDGVPTPIDGGATGLAYSNQTTQEVTLYLLPPDRYEADSEREEFIQSLTTIIATYPNAEIVSAGTFSLVSDSQERIGNVANIRFGDPGDEIGTSTVVIGVPSQILKVRSTFRYQDLDKALHQLEEALSELLGKPVKFELQKAPNA